MKTQVSKLKLLQKDKLLQLDFDNGEHFDLPVAYLRIHSPASDNHLTEEAYAMLSQQDLNINQIVPIGHYAVKLFFTDGYQNGIYSWDYLHELGLRYCQQSALKT